MEAHSDIRQGSSPQNVNDLFDYDIGLDEILQHVPSSSNANAPRPSTVPDASRLGLGLDEEVKVARKRQPVAKLDETRLLSQAGIPRLRRTAKQKLRLKGKGHEFSDVARLLNFYQLWLDDLFPRAKFADGLAIIEKLGHHKRLQIMRREWIEEEKPSARVDDTTQVSLVNESGLPTTTTEGHDTNIFPADSVGYDREDQAQSTERTAVRAQKPTMSAYDHAINHDVPDNDDELETLLREQQNEDATTRTLSTLFELNNIDGDEHEAMEELNILTAI
ncbi:replication fork protection component Swi3-domain-containing protein [Aspergillus alliaceus]|uniref:Chromosome segregation in meiosis protein n=1 Tax=Petromyces alliaceus TaxID=209559 RepID=A0A5N7BS43_PETAA|nr:replication fork protection component Swi3-domain-containing protein [Aspergillus alliaceus]